MEVNEAGNRYGRLLVVAKSPVKRDGSVMWVCQCDCGSYVDVRGSSLRRGHTRSCGCLQREEAARKRQHSRSPTQRHEHAKKGAVTPTYRSWGDMRARCANPRHKQWADYGGRGITVHPRWQQFENFLADMGERPPGMTLDRIDVNGHYEPSNCRWATQTQQQNNKRSNAWFTLRGETKSLADWARTLGLKYTVLQYRAKTMDFESAVDYLTKEHSK